MYSNFNWLFDVNSIGQFFKRLIILVLSITIFLVYIFTVGGICTSLITKNIHSKEYILITTSFINSIIFIAVPAVVVGLIILYFKLAKYCTPSREIPVLYGTISREKYKSYKVSKKYKATFSILILMNILLFLYSINNYYVIFDNKIEKHNIISLKQRTYSYNDIKDLSIGVKDRGKYGGSLYYKITFKDGNKINIADNILGENEPVESFRKFNDVVKNKNVKRIIDKKHFHDLVEDLDDRYVHEYEKIFE